MYWIIKLVQSLVKALNSEGTPGQVAAGMAMGACLGLTPLLNLHNLVVVAVILFFRVSVPGAMLGWLIFTPLGFLLDPVFDRVGVALLVDTVSLQDVWGAAYNAPVVALANPTNTIVVGSFVVWLVSAVPIFFLARFGVGLYRRTIYERYKDAKLFRAVRGSKLYNLYRLFRPSV
ncbi:MAG TPA: TIGR03546 family protein [Longimicrobiales bacterium]|nr:TIGR03546 family protein [Longimicrobiales bacterium]